MGNETPKSCEGDFTIKKGDLKLNDTDKMIRCENDRIRMEQIRTDELNARKESKDKPENLINNFPDSEK